MLQKKIVAFKIYADLLAILIFAIVLKFVDLPLNVISYINSSIKILSIFIMIICIKKFTSGNLFVSSIISGLVFAITSYLIFSSLNGELVIDMSIAYDLIFAVLVAVASGIIINILKRKTV